MRSPAQEQEIRELAFQLYIGKQHAPWYTAGNTPEAAVGDWLTAEVMLSHKRPEEESA